MVKKNMISLYLFLFLDTYALAEMCGKEGISFNRISGGATAMAHRYPWLVHYTYLQNGMKFLCAGSLISDRLVLTAKHCTSERDSWGEAKVGLHNIKDADYKSVKFKKVFYNTNAKDNNDIAIILLTQPVDLDNPKIGTICLPESQNEEYAGKTVRTAGWGMIGLRTWGNLLKDLNLVVDKHHSPNFLYTEVDTKLENNAKVHQDPCAGDSGGPLMYNKAGRWTIIGTVLGGGYNCNTGLINENAKLGVWNKVTQHLNWIKNIMKKFEGQGSGTSESSLDCKTMGGPSTGASCIFPFIFRNTEYRGCTLVGADNGLAWCSTQVDNFGVHVPDEGKWGDCSQNCPGNFQYLNDKTTPASIRAPTLSPASRTALSNKENHNDESTLAPAHKPAHTPSPSPASTRAPSNKDKREKKLNRIILKDEEGIVGEGNKYLKRRASRDTFARINSLRTNDPRRRLIVDEVNRAENDIQQADHHRPNIIAWAKKVHPNRWRNIIAYAKKLEPKRFRYEGTGDLCEPNEFQCDNQRCVENTRRCDSYDDCGDGSDERECGTLPSRSPCRYNEWECASRDECIPKSFQCDGLMDCQDQTDEIGCTSNYGHVGSYRNSNANGKYNRIKQMGDKRKERIKKMGAIRKQRMKQMKDKRKQMVKFYRNKYRHIDNYYQETGSKQKSQNRNGTFVKTFQESGSKQKSQNGNGTLVKNGNGRINNNMAINVTLTDDNMN